MKDLHADKRALNTALNYARTMVNNCEGAERFIIKDKERYIVKKESDNYLYKVEFKEGKLNVIDFEKEEKKARRAAKKVSLKLQNDTNVEAD